MCSLRLDLVKDLGGLGSISPSKETVFNVRTNMAFLRGNLLGDIRLEMTKKKETNLSGAFSVGIEMR